MSNGKGEYDVTGWMTPIVRCRLFLEWIVVSSVVVGVVVVVFYMYTQRPPDRELIVSMRRGMMMEVGFRHWKSSSLRNKPRIAA